ncbi:hypothetical protein EDD15DRAFT_2195703 [Pisolithus albus]|nr:hypothetical protein EDD15DRAFT_2195703 [Pisolithus albus]
MPIGHLKWAVIIFGVDSTPTSASLIEDILGQFQFADGGGTLGTLTTHSCVVAIAAVLILDAEWIWNLIRFVKIGMLVLVKRSSNRTKDAIKHEETSGAEVQSIQLLQSPCPWDVIPYE